MNGIIDWGDVTPGSSNKSSGNNGRTPFLWLKSGNTYKVRPVAKPVVFFKYFYKNGDSTRTAICEDPQSCPVRMAHSDKLQTPGERFAILVIDRADGELKIMEFPKSVALSIKAWQQATNQNPGGDEGVDWVIQITGSGKQGTKYSSTPTIASPFTNDEKKMILSVIKDEDGNNAHYLENRFKAHTSEQIEKRLFGEYENRGNGNTQVATAQAAPAPAEQASSPATVGNATTSSNDDVAIDW